MSRSSLDELLNKIASFERAARVGEALDVCHEALAHFPKAREVNESLARITASPEYRELLEHEMAEFSGMFRKGNLEGALSLGRSLSIRYPNIAFIPNLLGVIASYKGDSQEAVRYFESAVQIDPNNPEAHNNLGVSLEGVKDYASAKASYESALKINPGYGDAYFNLGNSLAEMDQDERAIRSYYQCLELQPENSVAWSNKGNSQAKMGQATAAVRSYEQAIAIDDSNTAAYLNLSRVKKFQIGDPLFKVMTFQLETDASLQDRINLNFALGKAFDDIGEFKKAFEKINAGNKARRELQPCDQDHVVAEFEILRKTFSGSLESVVADSDLVQVPIFIVGMPRSGTTLVEQILASRPKINGAGELGLLTNCVNALGIKPLTWEHLSRFRRDYLDGLLQYGGGAPFVTDKMPLNFRWIGYIKAAIPEARIINVIRNPVATCFSVFFHYFAGAGNNFAYSQEDIVHYYRCYESLMSYWNDRYPGQVYRLDYERLTMHQEKETRNLLEYCGVPWDEACLAFHRTERVVRTASSTQVRTAMYQGSSRKWKHYEQLISPITRAFT